MFINYLVVRNMNLLINLFVFISFNIIFIACALIIKIVKDILFLRKEYKKNEKNR